jgi:hypothetical protein
MRVVLIDGHFPGPDKLRTPIGTSTLDAVLDLNDLEPEEQADVRETMRREGFFQFGGGAEAEITMYEEDAWRELVEVIEENHPGVC